MVGEIKENKMKNTLENKIAFLNQNLKSKVVGDFSLYMRGIPENGLDFKEIYGTLNGINKSESQQFDVDFDLEDGFTYRNCFNDLCRNWSHTIHAQHLTVLKKPLSSIRDEDAAVIHYSHTANDVKNYYGGDWKRAEEKQEIKDIDYLRSKGYALPYMGLSVDKQIEYGWIKLS